MPNELTRPVPDDVAETVEVVKTKQEETKTNG